MEPRWDIAAVVVALIAIPLAMSPGASSLLSSIFRRLIRAIWVAKATCERLEWVDVPAGPLHQCTLPLENCEHIKSAGPQRSWDRTIGTFYNCIRRGTFVKKPLQLPWNTDYIRTDYKTLKAMVLLLQRFDGEGTRDIDNPSLDVVFKQIGDIWTAYIKISNVTITSPRRLNVTKHEMDGFLKGYPPWYQQPLVLANGNSINSPIKDSHDISRGGWIVAIGLSQSQALPIANDVMDCFFKDSYKPSGPIENALLRLHHCLKNISKALLEEEIVSEVDKLMQLCRENHFIYTNSALRRLIYNSKLSFWFGNDPAKPFWVDDAKEMAICASKISDIQAVLILKMFNQFEEPSDQDISELRPVLKIAIGAAITGVYAVAMHMTKVYNPRFYEKNRRALFAWPEQIKSRSVYLRDRFEDEDV